MTTEPLAPTGRDGRHLYTCPLCEAMCGLEIQVDNGRVTGIRGNPDDVWSHKQLLDVVSHTPIETEALDALLSGNHGWTDLVRRHIPYGTKIYSWWSYRAQNWQTSDRGRRLDHLLRVGRRYRGVRDQPAAPRRARDRGR